MKIGTRLAIIVMAVIACIFSSGGCADVPDFSQAGSDTTFQTYYEVSCDSDTKQLQLYEVYERNNPDGSVYSVSKNPDFGSPINGLSCSVSTENQNRPFTLSEAIGKGLRRPSRVQD
jgi:hypothetical protein